MACKTKLALCVQIVSMHCSGLSAIAIKPVVITRKTQKANHITKLGKKKHAKTQTHINLNQQAKVNLYELLTYVCE